MAFLIKCPNCQKDVSGTASRCPFCNADLTHMSDSVKQDTIYFSPDSGPAIHYPKFPEKTQTVPSENFRKKTQAPETEDAEYHSESGFDKADDEHKPSVQEPPSARKRRKARPAGRKLLGYRAGNPFYMFISVFYHMTASIGILYALSLSPQYMADGVLIFHICRVVLAAIMLFLPVLILSENKVRRKFPLLRSRKPASLTAGFLILYLPLGALFLASWYFCM